MFKHKAIYKYIFTIAGVMIMAMIVLVAGVAPDSLWAASHREAPLISLDATADITDFFMFRSYEGGKDDKVVLIMDVIPGEEPSSGPNYWNFDPNVRYEFHIDNNKDGKADNVEFYIQFKNEFRGINKDATLPLSYVALPAITSLDGAGSEGLGLRQRYDVVMIHNRKRHTLAENLIAVPSNVGPRTMPDYEALVDQGTYDLGNGIQVFAGQRQDPFYIDLGGVFDTLNLRRSPLPLLTPDEDANDNANIFGIDMLAGFNVHSIVLEVPASLLTEDGQVPGDTEQPLLGAYAATSRRSTTVLRSGGRVSVRGSWVQVQRLANPLVNELIIGTVDKDRWNALDPAQEARFEDYYLNPRLALALELVFGVPAAKADRTDLRDLLLKYPPEAASAEVVAAADGNDDDDGDGGDQNLSELLRLDISVAPKPLGEQKRLTVLAGDTAGWPNGRRPKDDVTDIAIRVVGGENYINGRAGDGINVDDAPLSDAFPFLATPFDGVNRVHANP